jgi:high-affinity nickel-transport protein
MGLVIAARTIIGALPSVASGGAVLGTGISGLFLFIIGLLSLFIARDVYKTFKKCRTGCITDEQLQKEMNDKNVTGRIAGRLFNILNEPWQIFPIGVLFGLGFDTATQIALMAAAVTVSGSVPAVFILVMPLLFMAGMVTVNSTMGVMMRSAYGWESMQPIRKVFFSLTITVISVLIAFSIGGIEMLQVAGMELGAKAGFWALLVDMNFGNVGYVVVTIFVVSWIGALLIYRHKQYEKKGAGAFKVGTRQTGGAPISAPAVVIEAAKTTDGTSQNAGTGNSGV